MPHLLIAGKLHPAGLALLRAAPVSYEYVQEITEATYTPLLHKADGLVIRTQPLTAATIAMGTRLKIVSRHGVGYDAVDVAALTARRIPLCIVGDVNSVSVAEHAMMLILAAVKRLVVSDAAVRDPAQWEWRNRLESGEVSGKRLLIIGFGRAGRHLARMAAGFDMVISAHDPTLAENSWPAGPVRNTPDLLAALAAADIVSLHVPKGDRPLIGAAELAVMKRTAVLVNTARGGVVDEAALVLALRSGKIGAAGLDVFENEPPLAENPLAELRQVVLTPHIAGLTQESAARMAVASVQNVLDFFAGRLDPALVVNGVP